MIDDGFGRYRSALQPCVHQHILKSFFKYRFSTFLQKCVAIRFHCERRRRCRTFLEYSRNVQKSWRSVFIFLSCGHCHLLCFFFFLFFFSFFEVYWWLANSWLCSSALFITRKRNIGIVSKVFLQIRLTVRWKHFLCAVQTNTFFVEFGGLVAIWIVITNPKYIQFTKCKAKKSRNVSHLKNDLAH